MAASRSASRRTSTRGRSASTGATGKGAAAKGKEAAAKGKEAGAKGKGGGDGLSGLAEQLATRILKPLGLVVLSRERIQETLDEAAERGRVTRSDANELATVLVQRGRQQTDELLGDIERLLGRGRQQLDTATLRARRSESVDRLVRGADRARRTIRVGSAFPIMGYDDLTAGQVQQRLRSLDRAALREVRDYELRHANRKSVLAAIDKRLG